MNRKAMNRSPVVIEHKTANGVTLVVGSIRIWFGPYNHDSQKLVACEVKDTVDGANAEREVRVQLAEKLSNCILSDDWSMAK